MGRSVLPLGRILGIPIGLDYSWFLIFILLTWTFAVSYYPSDVPGLAPVVYWILGAATAICLFASVLLHELGHSAVARRYQIPVRGITLFVFGGVSQIAAEPPSAGAEFWIAIAGPAVSAALAGVLTALEPVLGGNIVLLALTRYLASMNGLLALFNLLPGFPLDGGRIFRAVVWGVTHRLRQATMVAANVGRGIAFLFIVLGVWQMLSGQLGNGLWTAFIGWFLENAAVAQVQQLVVHDLLAGHKVAEVMAREYGAIPPDITLQQLVDGHILTKGQRSFPVMRGDTFLGLVTLHRIRQVPQAEWSVTPVDRVMIPVADVRRVSPDDDLSTALDAMTHEEVNQLPVMDHGRIVGILGRNRVMSLSRTIRELGV